MVFQEESGLEELVSEAYLEEKTVGAATGEDIPETARRTTETQTVSQEVVSWIYTQ